MKKIVLVYGVIAGIIVVVPMIVGIAMSGPGEGGGSKTFGYLVMLVALSLIFFGVKRYRDTELGGVIRFGRAFLLGLGIAAVASVLYVAGWEVWLAATDFAFVDEYTAMLIEERRSAGISGDELAAAVSEIEGFRDQYMAPWFRLPITFLEIFPVGLVIALISAALLRNPALLPAGSAPRER